MNRIAKFLAVAFASVPMMVSGISAEAASLGEKWDGQETVSASQEEYPVVEGEFLNEAKTGETEFLTPAESSRDTDTLPKATRDDNYNSNSSDLFDDTEEEDSGFCSFVLPTCH